ncbi:F-box protein At4g22390-like [Silene latifolia]|uniref:F-box protein At4g22390-like n=1 Tax=Silene latifolia TaxID=37657 RepID=UPI003D77007F
MWDDLPTEISNNILHRLPVKTLIKCTILSKSFLSLITSHDFISTQIAQHTNSHLLLRYFTNDQQELFHFEPDDETFSGFQTQGLVNPFPYIPGIWCTVAGCVNGVICLVDDCGHEGTLTILWNPSIRKFVEVPEPIMVYETYGGYESASGFGFDSISDDYKVVRVVRLLDLGPKFGGTQVEVFSLKSGCWRIIGVGPSYSIKRRSSEYIPCFLNGSVYWVGSRFVCPNNENVIVKFDMSTETFEIIQLPGVVKVSESKYTPILDFYVQECKGKLALVNRNYKDEIKSCSVWVMKEYGIVESWTKIFDFNIDNLSPCGMPRAFGFRKNGEVIMVKGVRRMYTEGEDNVLVSIDQVTHSETTFRKISADRTSFYLSTYEESMVLFKEGKGIEQQTSQLKSVPPKKRRFDGEKKSRRKRKN